jgi:hypothetical protein
VVAELVAVVSDCDGDNTGGSKLRFSGLDTVHNKMNRLAREVMVLRRSHYRMKHYVMGTSYVMRRNAVILRADCRWFQKQIM